jgi:hypothetical protein
MRRNTPARSEPKRLSPESYELAEIIRSAFGALLVREQQVVTLLFIENPPLTDAEAASRLGLPLWRVRSIRDQSLAMIWTAVESWQQRVSQRSRLRNPVRGRRAACPRPR